MDVNQQTTAQIMRRHNVDLLIHGHTHRPGIHQLSLPARQAQRIVLGDWYSRGNFLRASPNGLELSTLNE